MTNLALEDLSDRQLLASADLRAARFLLLEEKSVAKFFNISFSFPVRVGHAHRRDAGAEHDCKVTRKRNQPGLRLKERPSCVPPRESLLLLCSGPVMLCSHQLLQQAPSFCWSKANSSKSANIDVTVASHNEATVPLGNDQ